MISKQKKLLTLININKLRMIHYLIEWTNGAKESIYGSNYINALRLNGITPEMEHNIIDYEIV